MGEGRLPDTSNTPDTPDTPGTPDTPDTRVIHYPAPQDDISCFPEAYSAAESAEIFEQLKGL